MATTPQMELYIQVWREVESMVESAAWSSSMAGERVALVAALLLGAGLACAGGAPEPAPATASETPMRPFHEHPLLTLADGASFLDPLPEGAQAIEPAAVSLGLVTARLSDQRCSASLGPITTEVGLAYGDPRHDPWVDGYSVKKGLTGAHVLVQVQADLDAGDCQTLQDWLRSTYGPDATGQSYALSWSYKLMSLPAAGGGRTAACRVWVAFEPPRAQPGVSTAELLPLPDAHRRTFLRAWRDGVPRVATGTPVSEVVSEASERGLPQDQVERLAEQLEAARPR